MPITGLIIRTGKAVQIIISSDDEEGPNLIKEVMNYKFFGIVFCFINLSLVHIHFTT